MSFASADSLCSHVRIPEPDKSGSCTGPVRSPASPQPVELVAQERLKHEPPLVQDRSVQPALGPHVLPRILPRPLGRLAHVLQFLHKHLRVGFADGRGGLVQKIPPGIRNMRMKTPNPGLLFLPVSREPFLLRQLPHLPSQFLFMLPEPSRRIDKRAVRQRRKMHNSRSIPTADSDGWTGSGFASQGAGQST